MMRTFKVNQAALKAVKAEIVAIIVIDVYNGCRNCNAKVIGAHGAMDVCSKCNTKMKMARCTNQSVANVILEDEDGKEPCPFVILVQPTLSAWLK